jgi:hypothetical protein
LIELKKIKLLLVYLLILGESLSFLTSYTSL